MTIDDLRKEYRNDTEQSVFSREALGHYRGEYTQWLEGRLVKALDAVVPSPEKVSEFSGPKEKLADKDDVEKVLGVVINAVIPRLADPMRDFDQLKLKKRLLSEIMFALNNVCYFGPEAKPVDIRQQLNTQNHNYLREAAEALKAEKFDYNACGTDTQRRYIKLAGQAMKGLIQYANGSPAFTVYADLARDSFDIAQAMIMEERKRTKV